MEKDLFYKELLLQEKKLVAQKESVSKALDGVRNLLEYYKGEVNGSEVKKKDVPLKKQFSVSENGFDQNSSYKDKVKWIIFELKKAQTSDVRKRWEKLDKQVDTKTIDRETRKQLWQLESDGIIKSKPSGVGNRKIYYVEQ